MATMHKARMAFCWATDVSTGLKKVGIFASPTEVMNWPKAQQRRAIAWAEKERMFHSSPHRKNPMPVFLSRYADLPGGAP